MNYQEQAFKNAVNGFAEQLQIEKERVAKETLETVLKIEAEIKADPRHKELPSLPFCGLYHDALRLANWDAASLFEQPDDMDTAGSQIKFLRFAIALKSIEEWIDGKFRIGHQEDIPQELLEKMDKTHLTLDSSKVKEMIEYAFAEGNKEGRVESLCESSAARMPDSFKSPVQSRDYMG